MKNFKKILYLLTPYESKQAFFLLGMMLLMALLEMIGVLSIMPFMTVLVNTELIETNFLLSYSFQKSSILGIKTNQEFLFFLGVLVFLILIISLAFKFYTIYAQLRFTSTLNYSLAKRLVGGYLNQPYSWFLNRHSADLGKNILSEVGVVINQGLNPMLNLIRQSVVTFAILMILILVNPKLTFVVGSTLGIVYGLIYIFIRNFSHKIGQKRLEANKWVFTAINEAFGASKEIKVSGLEQEYIKRFSKPAKTLAQIQAMAGVISQSPRFALEAIAFGGMLLVVLYLMAQSTTFVDAVPIIALYAFAGYRLIPALQQIYASLIILRIVGPALDALHKDLKNMQLPLPQADQRVLPLNKNISLKNIYYHYPNTSRTALKDIHFNIPTHKTVGIVGATGSGKTTTVDIILGLLEPQQGTLEVDGKIINKQKLKAWQRSIGYVPQHIFLSDDTVAANIAFGIEHEQIDHKAVERAAKIAKLHEFVTSELPQKYQTTIGERGVRLSGGQRQRIGIARALYRNPQVLILDEATSALDNNTEKQVMNEIKKLGKNITIVMIAHRLSTVKECNFIILLDKGKLKGQGTFEELVEINDNFKVTASEL
tara:strand:- start:243 stop:2036 length:1794 start_codon:yes stop_codon:yes gene_type:complete